jgi:uncharacterized protein
VHVTLHLTPRCNFGCRYCYASPHAGADMTVETARAAVDFAVGESSRLHPGQSVGVIFFGGEPLLVQNVIREVTAYCRERTARDGTLFHHKITTNGALLDEAFLSEPETREIFVALSHDGVREAQDCHRVDTAGAGTFERLSEKIDLLLAHRPYAPVMLVTTPETVEHYAASVKYLFRRGFHYLICSLNYAGSWDEVSLAELKRQYESLAVWYEEQTEREEKFYFSPFEVKIASHVFPGSCRRERCELGQRQISVAPSGRLFPCVQFVEDRGDSPWSIGDVWRGVDEARRQALYLENAVERPPCTLCAIRERCNHFCGCLNKQATGSIRQVSPALCAHERIVLPIADRLAARLFKKKSALFIQKQYNELFPLISLAEDGSQKG